MWLVVRGSGSWVGKWAQEGRKGKDRRDRGTYAYTRHGGSEETDGKTDLDFGGDLVLARLVGACIMFGCGCLRVCMFECYVGCVFGSGCLFTCMLGRPGWGGGSLTRSSVAHKKKKHKHTRPIHTTTKQTPKRTGGNDGGVRLEPVKLQHGLGPGRLREEHVRVPHALLGGVAHLM